MIDLSRVRNYYVACGYKDLRRDTDGLAEIVMRQYGTELDEESLFLFCGRRTDRIKALYFSGDGYQTSQTWLKPLYRRLKKALLESGVIHADETVVQVLKADGKAPSTQSRMWVYASPPRSGKPVRYFEYQPDRKGCRAAEFLKEFHGCLVTDGYSDYEQVEHVTRCGCWAHMWRKWREAMPKGATVQTSQAAVGYSYCNKLFALERKFAGLDDNTRKLARQAESETLLEADWLWLKTLDPVLGSKLEDAVTYANNQKAYLSAFLEHGEVEISNNLAENAIRPFVVGRKNWLFSDTPKGTDSSAIVYTLVETAKANGVEPYAYCCAFSPCCRIRAEIHPMQSWTSCFPGIREWWHRSGEKTI